VFDIGLLKCVLVSNEGEKRVGYDGEYNHCYHMGQGAKEDGFHSLQKKMVCSLL
jgi:hypothetical protein